MSKGYPVPTKLSPMEEEPEEVVTPVETTAPQGEILGKQHSSADSDGFGEVYGDMGMLDTVQEGTDEDGGTFRPYLRAR